MNILDIKMRANDAEAETLREYLKMLLWTLWNEGEGFLGKRPFGNSSWSFDLYNALADAGLVQPEYTNYGTEEEPEYEYEFSAADFEQANALIFNAIEEVFKK